MEQMYSDIVIEHFMNPRNVGTIPDADGEALVGNSICGDLMKVYIKVKNNRLEEIRFQTFGCAAAIASASLGSEMAKGMTLEQAMTLTNEDVAKALGGLPEHKMHCSNLVADALHKAIEDYKNKFGEPDEVTFSN